MRTIQIANLYRGLRIDRRRLLLAIGSLDAAAAAFNGGCPGGELSLAFMGDSELARLHGEFMGDSGTTDVITFQGEPDIGLAGEICVSVDTARSWAIMHGRRWEDEVMLYVVHGWLHLAGYDDLRPDLKRVMRRAEDRALRICLPHLDPPLFALR